jgi:hypothetical protein
MSASESTAAIERNEKGDLLMNVSLEIRKLTGARRYNGGWTRRIDGLDKSRVDGYSLVGPFAEDRIDWCRPGLYLDCDIGGSRKTPVKRYALMRLSADGALTEMDLPAGVDGARDWAVRLWPLIEAELGRAAVRGEWLTIGMPKEQWEAIGAAIAKAGEMELHGFFMSALAGAELSYETD